MASVELLLYCIILVMCGVGIPVAVYRKSITSVYFLAYCVFVAVPTGIVYVIRSPVQNYVPYFASVLIHQITLLLVLWISPYGDTLKDLSLPHRVPLSSVQKAMALVIVGAGVLYAVIGIRAYGGSLPILDFVRHGTSPVGYRLHMWREVLPSIPFSSLLRSMAKTGCLFVGLRFLSAGKTASGIGILGLAFVTATMEGTKAGAIHWAIPIVLYLLGVQRVPALKVLPVIMIGRVGMLWASLLEARFDFRVAV